MLWRRWDNGEEPLSTHTDNHAHKLYEGLESGYLRCLVPRGEDSFSNEHLELSRLHSGPAIC